jgi:hypothetical protein
VNGDAIGVDGCLSAAKSMEEVWCYGVCAMGFVAGLTMELALWEDTVGLALSSGRCRMANAKLGFAAMGWADGFFLEWPDSGL